MRGRATLPAVCAPQARSFHHQDHQEVRAAERLRVLGDLRGWNPAASRLALASGLILLAACAPKPAAPPAQAIGLDCSLPFDVQARRITAQPGLNPAPKDPAEPYRYYSSPDGATSWLITEPGAPGHPAIMMQRAVGHEVKTTGCPYGDKAGYQKLLAYLDSLKAWHR